MDSQLRTQLAIYRGYERRVHAQLVRHIEALVVPFFHKTGYVGDDDKPLMAVFFPPCKSKRDNSHERSRKVRGARTLDSILGFVQGGVADDQWVGLSTRNYDTLLVDDLVALLPLAEKLATSLRDKSFSPSERKG